MDEADSFVTETVRKNALDLSFSPEVIWSSRTGLTFNSKASLDVDVPIATSFGGLRIHDLKLKLARSSANGDPIFEVEASTGLDVQLGPVVASIDRIGLRMGFDFAAAQKNLGFVDLGFGFKPPTGVGVAVDAPAVSGGGYLFLDADKGQYAGVVRLNIEGGIAVTAIGLITTRLPSGAPGFSFLVIITAEDFKPIPIGLGFSLTGIGGIVAINRTVRRRLPARGAEEPDAERRAVSRRIRSGTPRTSSARSITRFRHVTAAISSDPWRRSRWGSPPILTMDLGLVLELGNRTRLIVLGRVAAILPSEQNDLLRLQMNSLGVDRLRSENDRGRRRPLRLAPRRQVPDHRQHGDAGELGRGSRAGALDRRLPSGVQAAAGLPGARAARDHVQQQRRLQAARGVAISRSRRTRCSSAPRSISTRAPAASRSRGCSATTSSSSSIRSRSSPISTRRCSCKYHGHNLFKVSVAGQLSGPRPLHIRRARRRSRSSGAISRSVSTRPSCRASVRRRSRLST